MGLSLLETESLLVDVRAQARCTRPVRLCMYMCLYSTTTSARAVPLPDDFAGFGVVCRLCGVDCRGDVRLVSSISRVVCVVPSAVNG